MTNNTLLRDAYLYLGYPNVEYGIMRGAGYDHWYLHEINSNLHDTNRCYMRMMELKSSADRFVFPNYKITTCADRGIFRIVLLEMF